MAKNESWDGLVARQQGAFHVTQATAAGVDSSKLRREVRAGRLRRGLPGVYVVVGAPRTWTQKAQEVQLWAGQGSAFSFGTAGRLLELDVPIDTRFNITTPRNLRSPHSLVQVHRAKPMPRCDVTEVRGLRTTTMPRTIVDLAAVLPEEPLDIALDSAIRKKMWRRTFLARLEALARPGRPGIGVLRSLVAEREAEQGLTGSAFERSLLRLMRKHKLPLPVCQHPFRISNQMAFIDFAYPEFGIAIEADGYRWHDGRIAFEKDRVRVSELGSWGWRVLQITWIQLKYHPIDVLERLQRALSTPAISSLRS